mmetsp:Transcript_25629/g.83028  ORF Transcript_25629/g.83028 Transcript_25629/m.83028 type:complete len:547 (+) Transcript_25629:78-1718(+)
MGRANYASTFVVTLTRIGVSVVLKFMLGSDDLVWLAPFMARAKKVREKCVVGAKYTCSVLFLTLLACALAMLIHAAARRGESNDDRVDEIVATVAAGLLMTYAVYMAHDEGYFDGIREQLCGPRSVDAVDAPLVENDHSLEYGTMKAEKHDDREDDDDPYYGGEDPKKGRVHRPRMSRRPRVARATTDKHIMQTTAPSTSDEESLPLSSPDVSFHHRKLPREVASVASELGAVEDISDVTQRRFDTARRARAASRLADACSVDGPEASAKARNGVTRPMIETLIAMLNTHCKQPELDEFARALGAVAFDCPRNKVSMMEAGVVPVVLARVADPHCDHRYVVPLWRTLAAETGKYQSTLKRAAYGHSVATSDSSGASFLAENLCQIIATSYDAEELLLAARTVLSLLKHDAKHHHHQQQQRRTKRTKRIPLLIRRRKKRRGATSASVSPTCWSAIVFARRRGTAVCSPRRTRPPRRPSTCGRSSRMPTKSSSPENKWTKFLIRGPSSRSTKVRSTCTRASRTSSRSWISSERPRRLSPSRRAAIEPT